MTTKTFGVKLRGGDHRPGIVVCDDFAFDLDELYHSSADGIIAVFVGEEADTVPECITAPQAALQATYDAECAETDARWEREAKEQDERRKALIERLVALGRDNDGPLQTTE